MFAIPTLLKKLCEMKKILFLFLLLCNLFTSNAKDLQRVLSSDTTTPIPAGCTKVVFVKGSTCDAIPSVLIRNSLGDTFELVANESTKSPYMYFVPNGKYVLVDMHNVKRCCTALGDLKSGDSFEVPSVGYFSIESKLDVQNVVESPSYGPYPMYYEQVKPTDYSKVVVDSSDKYIGGRVILKKLLSNETYTLDGSATYFQKWYYFIPKGKYEVVSVGSNYQTKINGNNAFVGYTFSLLDNASIAFSQR